MELKDINVMEVAWWLAFLMALIGLFVRR